MGNTPRFWLPFLAGAGILAIIAQSIYLFTLQGQIDELQEQLAEATAASATLQPRPDPWSVSGFGFSDPFAAMQQRMDALLGTAFGNGTGGTIQSLGFNTAAPGIEVEETQDAYRIEVTVPRASEVELQTDVEDHTVRLAGSITYNSEGSGSGRTSTFAASSRFNRSLDLPKPVNALAMQTERLQDRIVITLPKA